MFFKYFDFFSNPKFRGPDIFELCSQNQQRVAAKAQKLKRLKRRSWKKKKRREKELKIANMQRMNLPACSQTRKSLILASSNVKESRTQNILSEWIKEKNQKPKGQERTLCCQAIDQRDPGVGMFNSHELESKSQLTSQFFGEVSRS